MSFQHCRSVSVRVAQYLCKMVLLHTLAHKLKICYGECLERIEFEALIFQNPGQFDHLTSISAISYAGNKWYCVLWRCYKLSLPEDTYVIRSISYSQIFIALLSNMRFHVLNTWLKMVDVTLRISCICCAVPYKCFTPSFFVVVLFAVTIPNYAFRLFLLCIIQIFFLKLSSIVFPPLTILLFILPAFFHILLLAILTASCVSATIFFITPVHWEHTFCTYVYKCKYLYIYAKNRYVQLYFLVCNIDLFYDCFYINCCISKKNKNR